MQVLKRHPFAVAIAALLLICGSIDKDFWKKEGSPPRESYYGLHQGHVVWGYYIHHDDSIDRVFNLRNMDGRAQFHFPTLGQQLDWGAHFKIEDMFEAAIPLWIPFLAVAAWIGLYEIIRHKKRTRR